MSATASVRSSARPRVRPSRFTLVDTGKATRSNSQSSRRARPALVKVAEPARRGVVVRFAAAALAVAGLFAVVVSHVVIDEKQFAIDSMQQKVAAEKARQTALEYQLYQLEAPQRVIAAAQSLGMVVPASVTYLVPVTLQSPGGTQVGGTSSFPSSKPTSPTTSPTGSARARAPAR